MRALKDILRGMPSRTLFNTGTLLVGGLIFSAAVAFADNDVSTQSVIGSNIIMPYDGYLMIDSSPITGSRTIKFELYDAAGGGNSVWSETQSVNIYNGRFSVGLGTAASLTNTILDAEKVWLAMTIIDTDAQGNAIEVELAGRQAIEPAPFAAWSANSADFNVGGDLDVAKNANITGNANVTGQVNAASAAITGQIGAASASVTGNAALGSLTVDSTSTLGNDFNADKTTINGVDNDGATAALTINSAANQQMLLDGNEIDVPAGPLYLQNNSTEDVRAESDVFLNGMFKFGYSNWESNDVGSGGAALANDNNSYKALMVVGNNSATGNDRQIKMYDDVIINKELSVPDLNVTDDLVVTDNVTAGNVYYQPDCPGSPVLEVANTSKRARMCVYTVGGGSNSDQDGIANRCWSNHGAELCTVSQMHIAVANGLSITEFYWLADRTADDRGIRTNTSGSTYNFDGEDDVTDNYNGGYCCTVLHGQ